MKIANGKRHARKPLRNVRAVDHAPSLDHDLPVLAAEQAAAAPRLDWEALMGDGVQPALLVDGERRLHGRR
ncbi:MAG TPA: hypothetical protein VLY46_06595 [Usitatibacter sp.]|nr:hypothetical protein [Usitatibacter sp.]